MVPQIAAGTATELDPLRAACAEALEEALDTGPGLVVVTGGGPQPVRWSEGDAGTLAGFGYDLTVALGRSAEPGRVRMPLSLTVGAWLLSRSSYRGDRLGFTVPSTASGPDLSRWAADLNDLDERVALLVMGDGSARRSTQAPGHLDERAEPFDAAVSRALADADAAALRDLDTRLGADLMAAGTVPWRLAGLAAGDLPFRGRVLYDAAPYGVGYLVAVWRA